MPGRVRITTTSTGGQVDRAARYVSNVIWCTGFQPHFAWIDLPVFHNDGQPLHERGVVSAQPGLYFVGLPFLYALTSSLVGGVGRDAEYIAKHIASNGVGVRHHRPSDQPTPPGARTATHRPDRRGMRDPPATASGADQSDVAGSLSGLASDCTQRIRLGTRFAVDLDIAEIGPPLRYRNHAWLHHLQTTEELRDLLGIAGGHLGFAELVPLLEKRIHRLAVSGVGDGQIAAGGYGVQQLVDDRVGLVIVENVPQDAEQDDRDGLREVQRLAASCRTLPVSRASAST